MSNEIRELSINELDSVTGGSDSIRGGAGPVATTTRPDGPSGPSGPSGPQPSTTPKSASFDPVGVHF
jgi:bacteriocin-like protein